MDNTKAINITASEIKVLMRHYGSKIQSYVEFAANENIERLCYLNKCLKDYKEEPAKTEETKTSW